MNRCFIGDCRETMRRLIAEGVKVNTCITSPPYWGLRDYGADGQLGLESSMQEYLANMVEVFGLVHQLLRDDGTLWLNIGDSYAGVGSGKQGSSGQMANRGIVGARNKKIERGAGRWSTAGNNSPGGSIKRKDLIGIPWRLAFALQDAGWYLRSDIIWSKPNPMPESVNDRPTKSHEYIFLLTKSEKYYYDQEAILEPVSGNTHARVSQDVANQIGSARAHGGTGKTNGNMKAVVRGKKALENATGVKYNESFAASVCLLVEKRNKRTVWEVGTKAFKGAHFATYPPKLIEPCVLAGSPPGGIVFDPFFGSGTTGEVAANFGRQWIGCEINPEYEKLQQQRIKQGGLPL